MVEIVVVEIVVVKMPKDEVHLYQLYNLLLLVGEPLEGALDHSIKRTGVYLKIRTNL